MWNEPDGLEKGDDDDGSMGGGNKEVDGDGDKDGENKRVADEDDGMGLGADMSMPPAYPMKIRNRSLQSLNSMPPSPAPTKPLSQTPTSIPSSPAPTSVEDVIMLPLCMVKVKKDGSEGPIRQYIRPNNWLFSSKRSKIIKSDISITDAKSDLKYMGVAFEGVKAIGDIADFRSKLTGVLALTEKMAKGVAAFGSVAIVATSLLGALGVLGESQETKNFNALVGRLDQIKTQLNEIRDQINEGFLDLKGYLSDIVLDDLADNLDAIGRAYNDYIEAPMEFRLSKYEPKLRDVCNTAFRTPEDIFYNLYGYVCENCTYAPKKRADFYTIAKTQSKNNNDQNAFMQSFGNFFLQSMAQAIFLRALCPDSIEGTCTDRRYDRVWINGTKTMEKALKEVARKLNQTDTELRDFVPTFKESNKIKEHVVANDDSQDAMTKSANDILKYLRSIQPTFHFQVHVFAIRNIHVTTNGCILDRNACKTDFASTGQIHFEDEILGAAVYIRYRSVYLPNPNTVFPDGQSFPAYYQDKASLVSEALKNAGKFWSEDRGVALWEGCELTTNDNGGGASMFGPSFLSRD